MTIIYLPLEPHPDRYSYQLTDWMETRLRLRNVPFKTVLGDKLHDDGAIRTGRVLDAHGRCYWALTQTAKVARMMEAGEINGDDVIFSEDMFHPGWEALPYILEQIPPNQRPKIFTRCLAQTFDPDDFVHPWRRWMRPFEQMVDQTATGILIASSEMIPFMQVGMMDAQLHLTGLPFDKHEVRSRVSKILSLQERKKRVVWASRFDTEKQPWFFMDLIEQSGLAREGIEFVIATGSKALRSNDPQLVVRARALQETGLLSIQEGLAKNAYYALLADSRVLFNSARQDWVSNTLNEASALGTQPLCPAFRAFPEALNNNPRHMYVPWSLVDAEEKLRELLNNPSDEAVSYAADVQHESLDRTIDVLLKLG